MNQPTRIALPLLQEVTPGGCCGGGSCACGTGSGQALNPANATPVADAEGPPADAGTQTFQVSGLTCGHCAAAVTGGFEQIPGVTHVKVDLVAGGTSTVRVSGVEPLTSERVTTALDAAGGYRLA